MEGRREVVAVRKRMRERVWRFIVCDGWMDGWGWVCCTGQYEDWE